MYAIITNAFIALATVLPLAQTAEPRANLDHEIKIDQQDAAAYELAHQLAAKSPERALEALLTIRQDTKVPHLAAYRDQLMSYTLLKLGLREQRAKRFAAAYVLFRSAGKKGAPACQELQKTIPESAMPYIHLPSVSSLEALQAIGLAHLTITKLMTLSQRVPASYPSPLVLTSCAPEQVVRQIIAEVTPERAIADYLYSAITLEPRSPAAQKIADQIRQSKRDDTLVLLIAKSNKQQPESTSR